MAAALPNSEADFADLVIQKVAQSYCIGAVRQSVSRLKTLCEAYIAVAPMIN